MPQSARDPELCFPEPTEADGEPMRWGESTTGYLVRSTAFHAREVRRFLNASLAELDSRAQTQIEQPCYIPVVTTGPAPRHWTSSAGCRL